MNKYKNRILIHNIKVMSCTSAGWTDTDRKRTRNGQDYFQFVSAADRKRTGSGPFHIRQKIHVLKRLDFPSPILPATLRRAVRVVVTVCSDSSICFFGRSLRSTVTLRYLTSFVHSPTFEWVLCWQSSFYDER